MIRTFRLWKLRRRVSLLASKVRYYERIRDGIGPALIRACRDLNASRVDLTLAQIADDGRILNRAREADEAALRG